MVSSCDAATAISVRRRRRRQPLKASVSPISYVSKDDPPILIVHGDADDIVPIEHAQRLEEKLEAAGVESELFVVEGGKHNVAGAGGEDVAIKVTAFLKEHLGIEN